MPRKFKFCVRCRRTIVENDVQRGLFVQTPDGMLCATCAQQLDEETEAAKKLAASQEPVPTELLPAEEASAPVSPLTPPAQENPTPEPSVIPHSATPVPSEVEDRTPRSDPPPDPQSEIRNPHFELLNGIREHLEGIHRTLVFEKSSAWNVFATVAQCLAVGMLILAAVNWADNPMQLLLVALIFQVMALTFYVRGK